MISYLTILRKYHLLKIEHWLSLNDVFVFFLPGKARRGDGNDVTPNPRKLYNLGVELNQLNKKITGMTPVSELPAPARTTCRREKNKYASRACRLKKKAQHEANKIKYTGLKLEHSTYAIVIIFVGVYHCCLFVCFVGGFFVLFLVGEKGGGVHYVS